MHSIHRRFRHVAIAVVSALLVACGQDEAIAPQPDQPTRNPEAPGVPVSAVGKWGSHRVDDQALPARIAGGTEDGITWELRAIADTLVIKADGTWQQHSRVRQTQSDGAVFGGTHYDRGVWTRDGDALHFESTYIQHVRFDGHVTGAGELVVLHDFTLDDEIPVMRREMKR